MSALCALCAEPTPEPDDLAFARGFLLALPLSLALWAGIIATLMQWM